MAESPIYEYRCIRYFSEDNYSGEACLNRLALSGWEYVDIKYEYGGRGCLCELLVVRRPKL